MTGYSGDQKGPRARAWQAGAIASAAILLASCSGGGGDNPPVEIRTLSTRADLVTGGDALVEIVAPASTSLQGLKVTLDGTDVTSSFARRADGRTVGLVSGLATGPNVLRVTTSDAPSARLVLTNAPRSGPVLSGAQATPFHCATPTPQPASGNTPQTAPSGLSGQADANCSIPTEFRLYYRTTAATPAGGCPLPDPYSNNALAQPAPAATQCWKPYTPGTTPADMAPAVTTDAGVTLPFVVRLERGTINRGIYDIAVLFDATQQQWSPTAPQPGWNRKVHYSFGASTGQPRRQVRPAPNWTAAEEQLRRGYLVAQNSMTDSARNSNRVMMSETVMMMKEHIGDTYGPVKFTVGSGCSGGSINANMNLSILPGLLDGVITSCTYPDSETTALEVGDCTLLVEAYQKPALLNLWASIGLTQAQINARKAAINGHQDQTGCQAWFNSFGSNGKAGLFHQRTVTDQLTGAITQSAVQTNNCELPNGAVYDPANPVATAHLPRCDAWSWGESIWGRVPGTQQPRDTRDNVGVQYGLGALLSGTISGEEFVTLNEVVGGVDRDATARPQRSSADLQALEIAYRAGIVASGRQLAKAAIIDLRGWDDSLVTTPPGSIFGLTLFGIHHQWFSWAIRERIVREAGDAGNQALWRFARGAMVPSAALSLEAMHAMDQWLTMLVEGNTGGPLEQRVRAARPASTRDFCYLSGDAGQGTKVFDASVCDADPFLRPAASPRQVAGGPRAEDVLKCQLRPLALSDYPAGSFTPAQFARLQAVFATGVCDFGKPGVGQQAAQSPLTFAAGPGGRPLGNAPVSTRE